MHTVVLVIHSVVLVTSDAAQMTFDVVPGPSDGAQLTFDVV